MDSQEGTVAFRSLICPTCAHSNPAHAAFCQSCGAPVIPAAAPPTAATTVYAAPPPDQLRALQGQVASLQGQLQSHGAMQTDTAVRTALNSARIRSLIVLALIVVIVIVAGQSTGTSNGSTNCWSWVLRGSTNAYGAGGHGFLVCVG